MGKTYKSVKLTGEGSSLEGAIDEALTTSGSTVRGQSWFEVVDIRGNIGDDGSSVEAYQVTLEVNFLVELGG